MTREPFYPIKYNPAEYLALGSIKCEASYRALDVNNDPIPDLHASEQVSKTCDATEGRQKNTHWAKRSHAIKIHHDQGCDPNPQDV